MRARLCLSSMLFVGMSMCLGRVRAASAQGDSSRVVAKRAARILGVYDQDSGQPVEGVRVGDMLTGTFATTTATGTVALSFLNDGGSMIRLQKLGYQPQTMFVAVTPRDTAPLTIVLARAVELPAVVTNAEATRRLSPALRGFDERQHAGQGGHFIGDSVLRKEESSTVGNVLRRVPGVRLASGAAAMWLLPTTWCNDGSHAGPPQVYLDGIPWTPPTRPDAPHVGRKDLDGAAFNLDDFQITELAGVEFYPDNAALPTGLNHNAQRCGALFLWTRQ